MRSERDNFCKKHNKGNLQLFLKLIFSALFKIIFLKSSLSIKVILKQSGKLSNSNFY